MKELVFLILVKALNLLRSPLLETVHPSGYGLPTSAPFVVNFLLPDYVGFLSDFGVQLTRSDIQLCKILHRKTPAIPPTLQKDQSEALS